MAKLDGCQCMATEVNLSDTQTELQKDGETHEEKGDKSKFEDVEDGDDSVGGNEENKDSNDEEEENEQASDGDFDEEKRASALRQNELTEGDDRDYCCNPEADEVSNQSDGVVQAVDSVVEGTKENEE